MKRICFLALMLCGLAYNAVALHISAFASDWPDACHPDSVSVHWQFYDGQQWYDGWSYGRLLGPDGSPLSYRFDWCSDIPESEPIPLYASINELRVKLAVTGIDTTSVVQYININASYVDCFPAPFPIALPAGTFLGCEEMQSAIGDSVLPQALSLVQNYPNPFNPTTTIKFSLPIPGNVQLIVRNLFGQRVAELANDQLNAGNHELQFSASNLSSGLYFYTLTYNGQSVTKQMLLLK